MIKLLTALAALTMAMPAVAGTAHDFDPSNVNTSRGPKISGCYRTNSKDTICFFQIQNGLYNVGINDAKEVAPEVMTVDCRDSSYQSYGPLDKNVADAYAQGFCSSGRF